MSAESLRDYIGAGEWHGDTDCQLAKFADEMAELQAEVAEKERLLDIYAGIQAEVEALRKALRTIGGELGFGVQAEQIITAAREVSDS